MKKIVSAMMALCLISACSDKENANEQENTPKTGYEDIVFNYKAGELKDNCTADSPMVCAMDIAAKCTIDPKRPECDKNNLPKFIFMEDESLQRPTEMTFRIYKLKPLKSGSVEVYTESTCNGNWFGLCQGNIIYVLTPMGENWKVNDIYAMALPITERK